MSKNKLYIGLLALGVLLFVLAGFLWWRNVYNSPHRVFWGMVNSNLATEGVTRQMEQTAPDGTSVQKTQLIFGDQAMVRTEMTIKQKLQDGESTVVSEGIGTTEADYNRYVQVETGAKNADGKEIDFSDVVNVWGKTGGDGGETAGAARLLPESLLGVVLFGNLDQAQRQELVQLMTDKQVYAPKYDSVERQEHEGRSVMVYEVDVQPQAYIEMLQKYVEMTGLKGAEGLNPEQYAGEPAFTIKMAVDPVSRQLKRLDYPEGTNRSETYSAYGAQPAVEVPAESIPLTELQQRIQRLQQ